jgi:hypothetical protein
VGTFGVGEQNQLGRPMNANVCESLAATNATLNALKFQEGGEVLSTRLTAFIRAASGR